MATAEEWDRLIHDASFGDEMRWELAAKLAAMESDLDALARKVARLLLTGDE